MESLMYDPPHPGEVVLDGCLADTPVPVAANLLGIAPADLARVLDGRAGITPDLAIRMEGIGWSTAAAWMRMQAHYDLAQERLRRERQAA